ncbi:MAG: AAA family ATPase [Armatimonas sp.]
MGEGSFLALCVASNGNAEGFAFQRYNFCMYLRSLHLENFACFDDVLLDFTDESGEACKWVVLLGENGTGKTNVLRAILAALGMYSPFEKIKYGTKEGSVIVKFQVNSKFDISIKTGNECYLNWRFSAGSGSLSGNIESDIMRRNYNWCFLAGYGSKRLANLSAIDYNSDSIRSSTPESRIMSLLGNNQSLVPLKAWLSDLDYESLKLGELIADSEERVVQTIQGIRTIRRTSKKERETALARFEEIKNEFLRGTQSLEMILPEGAKFSKVTPEKEVIFDYNGDLISIDNLSDGYQSMIGWVGDLVRHMVRMFPGMENPLLAKGVVLIDEIDIHLHPFWQRTIVKQIRSVFPNLQFIVTSHSPFVAQDLGDKDKIIVLSNEKNKIIARHEHGFVKGWRASQILTSWLFGLQTDYDEEIEKKNLERQALGDKKAQWLLTDEEREKLRQVTEYLDSVRAEPTETGDELLSADHLDAEAVRSAASVVLKLLRKVEGK